MNYDEVNDVMPIMNDQKQCCEKCRYAEDDDKFPFGMLRCSWHSYKTKDYSMLCVNKKDIFDGYMPETDIYVKPNFFCNRFMYKVLINKNN